MKSRDDIRLPIFMAELARGDAIASLPQRTGLDDALPGAFARYRSRFAPGSALDERGAYAVYAAAFSEAVRSNRGEGFVREGDLMICQLCNQGMLVERTRPAVLSHVLDWRHLMFAEARDERAAAATKKKGPPRLPPRSALFPRTLD